MSTRVAAALAVLVCLGGCSGTPGSPSSVPVPDGSTDAVVPPAPAILVGAGDVATCGSPGAEMTARLLDAMAGTVLAAGDLAYPHGRAEDFRNCYAPSWGRHRGRTRPAPGNHEYDTPGAAPYYEYFGSSAGVPGHGYYSYDLGAWHIVSLNSEVDVRAGGRQEQWLRADLTASRALCTAAYFHRPRFSSGRHGSQGDMQDLWRTLHEFRVEAVISAHDHHYERFAPLDAAGRAAPQGVRQFVVGTGGAPIRGLRALQPTSEVQGTEWGVLKLTLLGTGYLWEFVPVEGGTFTDAGSASCY